MKSQHVSFLTMSRASSVIPHTEHLHQAVSSCFWLLPLCCGLLHCSGKASQPKDATCFFVNCCKNALSPPCRMRGGCGRWTNKEGLSQGCQWNEESPDEVGLIWATPTMRVNPWFQPWCPVQPSFPKVQSCCQQVEMWFEQRTELQQERVKVSPHENLVPSFKIKTESH